MGKFAALVASLLERRVGAKLKRDYEQADGLQAEIRAMGVFIDDRRRTWKVESTARANRSRRPAEPEPEAAPEVDEAVEEVAEAAPEASGAIMPEASEDLAEAAPEASEVMMPAEASEVMPEEPGEVAEAAPEASA